MAAKTNSLYEPIVYSVAEDPTAFFTFEQFTANISERVSCGWGNGESNEMPADFEGFPMGGGNIPGHLSLTAALNESITNQLGRMEPPSGNRPYTAGRNAFPRRQ